MPTTPNPTRGTYLAAGQPTGVFSQLWKYRGLVKNLIVREVVVRHKSSVLGVSWSMLSPLIMMAVMALVFSRLFNARMEGGSFTLYILSGLIFWNLFSQSTAGGLVSLTANAGLIRKVSVPRIVFPISSVGSGLANFGFSAVTVIGYMLFIHAKFSWSLFLTLIPAAEICLMALGISSMLSVLHVYFRDVKWFYDSALLAWFYATPLFYPAEILGKEWLPILKLNPLWPILRAFRNPIMNGSLPAADDLITGGIVSLAVLAAGWTVFRSLERDFINYL